MERHITLNIINKYFNTEFPQKWKIKVITSTKKIAKTKSCEEFRPINTLETYEEIIEKVFKIQLEYYFRNNNRYLVTTFHVKLLLRNRWKYIKKIIKKYSLYY